MKITKDDFEQWLANPVTEQVMRALARFSEQTKQDWLKSSWGSGNADPLLLADLRARAEVVKDLTELKFEDIETDDER